MTRLNLAGLKDGRCANTKHSPETLDINRNSSYYKLVILLILEILEVLVILVILNVMGG